MTWGLISAKPNPANFLVFVKLIKLIVSHYNSFFVTGGWEKMDFIYLIYVQLCNFISLTGYKFPRGRL